MEHLITRPVRLGQCPRCRAFVLGGYTGGLFVRVDPSPLDPKAEMLALLGGRHTYDLITEGYPRRLYLDWRCSSRINGARRHPVVGSHPCTNVGFTATDLPVPEPDICDPSEPPPF